MGAGSVVTKVWGGVGRDGLAEPAVVAVVPGASARWHRHWMPDPALAPPPTPWQDVPPFCVVAGNPARVIKRLRQGEQGGDQAAGVEAAPPHKKAALDGAGGKPAAEGGS